MNHRGRAEDLRFAVFNQDRALGVLREVARNFYAPFFICFPAVCTFHFAFSLQPIAARI